MSSIDENQQVEPRDPAALRARAHECFERGGLVEAEGRFEELLLLAPDVGPFHYMLGLTQKYRRNWSTSLAHNLRAQALAEEFDEAAAWNAGIAATALGDWAEARRQWALCGIELPGEAGPIDGDFGVASVRLNPWGSGETVFARRLDPVRARILNVPLPESGYCHGDIVLHDGAPTGQRAFRGGRVSVFNALERWQPSLFQTFTAFVTCPTPDDASTLAQATGPGIGVLEDWTQSLRYICLSCSYGLPHSHEQGVEAAENWQPARTIGIAAQTRQAARHLLDRWLVAAPGRTLGALETRSFPVPDCPDGQVWWRSPDVEGDALQAHAGDYAE